jgi:hypothetical protein
MCHIVNVRGADGVYHPEVVNDDGSPLQMGGDSPTVADAKFAVAGVSNVQIPKGAMGGTVRIQETPRQYAHGGGRCY